MSRSLDKDPTRFFSVVGTPYTAERRTDAPVRRTAYGAVRADEISLSVSVTVLFTLIAAIAIFAGEFSILASVGLTNEVMAAVVE